MSFVTMPGTPGLTLDEVGHILVTGRGRDATGHGLGPETAARVPVAVALFDHLRHVRIICCGYKSPTDDRGEPWSPADAPEEVFRGVPEADAMKRELLRHRVPARSVRVERHSIDTVTGLLRAEGEDHFGDDRPVAVVAQPDQLRRILSIVAPRTLRRPYLGVVVPAASSRTESPLVDLVSRLILVGLPRDPARAVGPATRRAERIGRHAPALGRLL